jgi:hypothetical protein
MQVRNTDRQRGHSDRWDIPQAVNMYWQGDTAMTVLLSFKVINLLNIAIRFVLVCLYFFLIRDTCDELTVFFATKYNHIIYPTAREFLISHTYLDCEQSLQLFSFFRYGSCMNLICFRAQVVQ